MGNCFAKRQDLVNNSPAIFPDAQGLYSSSEGSSSSFDPLQTYDTQISSSLDFNGSTCSSDKDLSAHWPCSVDYSKIGHDSAVKKTASPEQVSVGGSVNQSSCKLAHLLEKSFVDNDNGNGNGNPPMELVTTRLSPILLSPLRKSSGKSTSMGLMHECYEDPVHSKTESPRTKFVGLIVNHLVKRLSSVRSNSVRNRSSSKVDTISSAMIFNTIAGDGISGICIPKEPPSLSSILSQINMEKNNGSGRVGGADTTAATFNRVGSCEIQDYQPGCMADSFKPSRGKLCAGLCRSYSLAVEGEKAFGSPLSVESNNLWGKTRDCSAFDEFSDSSSDLFDIDFLKPELVAGVAFSLH